MIRFDKLKILVPFDCITDMDTSYANAGKLDEDSESTYQDMIDQGQKPKIKDMYGTYTLKKEHGIFGLDTIIYDRKDNNVILTINGKIMGNDYYDLIHKNNIKQALEMVNTNKFIKFDIDKVISESHVLLCDITDNMKVRYEVLDYLDALEQLKVNKDYHFNNDKKGTLYFDKLKGKIRGKFYDKHKHLVDDKALQSFLTKYPILKQFDHVLRMEQSISKFVELRKILGNQEKGPVKLIDILHSKKNPNRDVFLKLSSGYDGWYKDASMSYDYFNNTDTLGDIEKQLGMRCVCEHFGYNMQKIKNFINSHSKGNNSAKIKIYKQFINDHREDWNHDLLTEIKLWFKYGDMSGLKCYRYALNRNFVDDDILDEEEKKSDSDAPIEYNTHALFDDEDEITDEEIIKVTNDSTII